MTNSKAIDTLQGAIEAVVNKHTGEWKAGHNHLVVDQLLAIIEKEQRGYLMGYQAAIREAIGVLPEKMTHPVGVGVAGSAYNQAITEVLTVLEGML
jgi:hypothetical protein